MAQYGDDIDLRALSITLATIKLRAFLFLVDPLVWHSLSEKDRLKSSKLTGFTYKGTLSDIEPTARPPGDKKLMRLVSRALQTTYVRSAGSLYDELVKVLPPMAAQKAILHANAVRSTWVGPARW
jgi:hypothetical protein